MDKNEMSPVEIVPPPTLDFSQFAPLVAEFQRGEIEKMRIAKETETGIARMNFERQNKIDSHIAARIERQDMLESRTTYLLAFICFGMTGYGMWNHDAGFVTAGLSSFSTFLVGMRTGRHGAKTRE